LAAPGTGAALHSITVQLLALDFDGVICNSIREVFVVALRTYASLYPYSSLVCDVELQRSGHAWREADLSGDPVYHLFEELLPLGNRAEDFGVALGAIERKLDIGDQERYDAFYRSLDPTWLDEFHSRFYQHRKALRDDDPQGWIGLHSDYKPFTALLLRSAHRARFAIATAKDGASVNLLLESFGLAGLIPADLVLDKQTGVHKTDHLQVLAERLRLPLGDITFIDDKLNHLQRVAQLGVRPVLAGWGYNTAREHALARREGIAVASLDTADALLFNEDV
jgi:phosphoglycolate phosphatase-like HAD superfamily hydrolase